MYSVKNKYRIEKLVEDITKPLIALGRDMPRVLIFCKQYDECSTMYRMFKQLLGPHFTFPSSAPDLWTCTQDAQNVVLKKLS